MFRSNYYFLLPNWTSQAPLGTNGGGLSYISTVYMSQWVERRPTTNDYAIQGADFGNTAPWLVLYTRALADIEIIIKKGTELEAYPYRGNKPDNEGICV